MYCTESLPRHLKLTSDLHRPKLITSMQLNSVIVIIIIKSIHRTRCYPCQSTNQNSMMDGGQVLFIADATHQSDDGAVRVNNTCTYARTHTRPCHTSYEYASSPSLTHHCMHSAITACMYLLVNYDSGNLSDQDFTFGHSPTTYCLQDSSPQFFHNIHHVEPQFRTPSLLQKWMDHQAWSRTYGWESWTSHQCQDK